MPSCVIAVLFRLKLNYYVTISKAHLLCFKLPVASLSAALAVPAAFCPSYLPNYKIPGRCFGLSIQKTKKKPLLHLCVVLVQTNSRLFVPTCDAAASSRLTTELVSATRAQKHTRTTSHWMLQPSTRHCFRHARIAHDRKRKEGRQGNG